MRKATLQKLREMTTPAVLIVGAGINGAGLFRELALQGVDCLLVDKSDYATGASSASSRMIHGGLRYLENAEFRLVREALLERNRLLKNAPHCVHPLKTTIPIYSLFGGILQSARAFFHLPTSPGSRGAFIIKVGLCLYDFLARKHRVMPPHFFTPREKSLANIPGLNPRIRCIATYYDAWITQPERLCLELILDGMAAHPRAHALNYVAFNKLEADGAVVLQDTVGGVDMQVRPRVLVNATGAWIDFINLRLQHPTNFIDGTKGSHLVLDNPELLEQLGNQMVFYENEDGRVCLVFPYMDKVLVGSTDIRCEDPDQALCDQEETEYLLGSLQLVFPHIKISDNEIVYKFSGIRPLAASESSLNGRPGAISRDHSLRRLEAGGECLFPIYSLVGGKWTTFRAFAEQAADKILDDLGNSRSRSTVDEVIGGGKNYPDSEAAREQWLQNLRDGFPLTPERADQLFARYGTRAAAFAGGDPTPLQSQPDYSIGEIETILKGEHVARLADLVQRRTTLAILGRVTIPLLEELAAIAAKVLGWTEEIRRNEISLTIDLLNQRHGASLVRT